MSIMKTIRYYKAYGTTLARSAVYNALAKAVVATGFSPLMRQYETDTLKLQHHMEEYARDVSGVYTMPACTATIETAEEYVLAYLQRGLYKNLWLRKKPRRVKLQYYPFPDRPLQRQAIAPFMLYLMTEAEADEYSEADAVIEENVATSVMDMTQADADEYWRAKDTINRIGAAVMARLNEQFPTPEERTKYLTGLGETLEGGLDATLERYNKRYNTTPEKRALDMKASKYIASMGSGGVQGEIKL